MTNAMNNTAEKKPFMLLITGSRTWTDYKAIRRDLANLVTRFNLSVIVGDAKGADRMASYNCGLMNIPCKVFKADWNTHGKLAGFKRNEVMVNQKPDGLIAYRINESKGTTHCIRLAEKAGIKCHIRDMHDKKLQSEQEGERTASEIRREYLTARLDSVDAPLATRAIRRVLANLAADKVITDYQLGAIAGQFTQSFNRMYNDMIYNEANPYELQGSCVMDDNRATQDALGTPLPEPEKQSPDDIDNPRLPSGKTPVEPTDIVFIKCWYVEINATETPYYKAYADETDIRAAYGLEPQDPMPCEPIAVVSEKFSFLAGNMAKALSKQFPKGTVITWHNIDNPALSDSGEPTLPDDFAGNGLHLVNIDNYVEAIADLTLELNDDSLLVEQMNRQIAIEKECVI